MTSGTHGLPPRAAHSGNAARLAGALVALITFACFLPALRNGFVDWDDDVAFLANPDYRGLGLAQLHWMWTTFYAGIYRPLSWMTYGLDYVVWGLDPRGYHLTNLLLHAANACLVYLLARRLLGAVTPAETAEADRRLALSAAAAALFFALHPLRVEAVAWVSARADVLCASFLLLSTLAYLRYCARSSAGRSQPLWLAVAAGLYALSLLAKPVALAFPVVLIVLDLQPLRRLRAPAAGRLGWLPAAWWYEKVPFFGLAVAGAVLALVAKAETYRAASAHRFLFGAALSMFNLAFGLWKTLLPLDLSPLYERPVAIRVLNGAFVASGAAVVCITALLLLGRRRWPALLAAWACYVALLLPTSGIIPFGQQLAADRFTYLPGIVLSLVAGAASLWFWHAAPAGRAFAGLVAACVLAGLARLTWQQTEIWRDSQRLWSYTVSVSPTSSIAHNNLGRTLMEEGKFAAAMSHFEAALDVDPDYPSARENLAVALMSLDRLDEARAQFEQALRLRPDEALLHNNFGVLLARSGSLDGATLQFRAAVDLQPAYAEARNNLASALTRQGRTEEAVQQYAEAAKLDPGSAEIRVNFGDALAATGKLEEAVKEYQQAVDIEPGQARAHNQLGLVLLRQQRVAEAVAHFQRALQIAPGFSEARQNLDAASAVRR